MSDNLFSHLPVLPKESLEAFGDLSGLHIIDGTLGGAGHTKLFLEKGAFVYGIDQDPYALSLVKSQNLERLQIFQGNFREMDLLLADVLKNTAIDGVFLDIGVSSFQLDDQDRGFSYHKEADLDMRMSQQGLSAFDIVNNWETEKIAALIYEYSEDIYSRKIARAIERARSKSTIQTTTQLADIIKQVYPNFSKGIHPARRTFQALRIAVNDELNALREGLAAAISILEPNGILAVISFHSLEDRIVKRFFQIDKNLEIVNKRPIIASEEELKNNPRSRSAKLRIAKKVALNE